MRSECRIVSQRSRIRSVCFLLVLVATLTLTTWNGSLESPANWNLSSRALADGRVSLGDLPAELAAGAAEYTRALTEFRNALINASGRPPNEICDDPQLVSQTAKCYRLHAIVQGIYGRILARVAPDASPEERREIRDGTRGLPDIPDMRVEDHLALARATSTYNQLEPGHTATVELSAMGECGMRSVGNLVRQLQQEEEARQQAKEDRANFMDGLLKDALGDAEANGEDPNAPSTPPGTDQPAGSAWDQARFAALYRQFTSAYREFKVHAKNFLDQLDLLTGSTDAEAHHVCEDPILAYSYAQAFAQGRVLFVAFVGAQAQVVDAAYNSVAVPVEDQLAFAEMQTNRDNTEIVVDLMTSDLQAKGAGCDGGDLEDEGRRIAESGQDPETGVDGGVPPGSGGNGGGGGLTADFTASPTSGPAPLTVNFTDLSYGGDIDSYQWTFSDGGSSIATNPSHRFDNDGTYTVSLTVSGPDGSDTETKAGFITVGSDELRYVKTGDLWTQETIRADCSGGTMTLQITSEPILPAEIRPDGNYTVRVPVSWSVSGPNAEDFAFVAVLHFNGFNRSSEQIKSPRTGSRTFEFSFSGSEVNFSDGSWPLTIQVAGGLTCGSTNGETNSTYVQQYVLHGGN